MAGIKYGHDKSISHRDIKLENILLDDRLNVKIIDYGFSIVTSNTKNLSMFCGTPSYMVD